MIEMLKVFGESSAGDDKEKLKISVEGLRYAMTNMGEKMIDHELESILSDCELVYEEYIVIEEFAKYLMSR